MGSLIPEEGEDDDVFQMECSEDEEEEDEYYGSSSSQMLLPPSEDPYYQRHRLRIINDSTSIPIPPPSSWRRIRKRKYPREIRKTLLSGAFMIFNFVATTASLALVHEDRPLYQPLPDQILDRIKFQDWALDASEILLQITSISTIVIILFHKYRLIVMTRVFFILGLLYGYRAITMFVTVLPSANPSYHCAPKLVDSGRELTFSEVARRVFKILSGFGLSINGQHVYCGDFIYSGHTMIAVLCYLVITEYTNKKWFVLHWIYWILAMTAVIMLMLARGHYSIDILIAYYITTRLFWLYHSIAYHEVLKKATTATFIESNNRFTRIWWWRILVYFESNIHSGQIPNTVNCPFNICGSACCNIFKRCFNKLRSKSNTQVASQIQSTINGIKRRTVPS